VESGRSADKRVAVIGPSTGDVAAPSRARSLWAALATGAGVGLLGGLIGLGGAEFRLPLLIGLFGFATLEAVIMNKALSLILVVSGRPARLVAVPFDTVNGSWFVVANLLAGGLIGAWIGATWATRTLYRVLAVLLVLIAIALAWNHFGDLDPVLLDPVPRTLLGPAADVGISIVAALMGVAGGELLIPTSCCCSRSTSRSPAASPSLFPCPPCCGVRPLQPRPQLRSPARQQGLRARHGGRIDHRHHPRRSSPLCRPRRRTDPPPCWSRSSSRLRSRSGARPDNQILVPALLAVAARGV
jgi:uncharacterized membrane protein YfcA